ncbi:hypothetical protein M885DRAFT_536312 [Pelagophyceae sp. CCMP2097]|nr:hypothetical protein M885DRAFT_536312 [Pelagophyceae sp. CCMP2097]
MRPQSVARVAGMMDQFKKAQEIAKKSAEMQAELGTLRIEGASTDRRVKFVMTGSQTPVSCAIDSLDGFTGATLSAAATEALKAAQVTSLEGMNAKMGALYATMGLGGM